MTPGDQESGFARMISPLEPARFIGEFWSRSFVHVPGRRGKFEPVLCWDGLNAILREHRLVPPRLRLQQGGASVSPKKYLTTERGSPRLKPASLVNCLAQGATLVVDAVEEFSPALHELARSCRDVLRADTVINLYAGWRTQSGLDLHWDPQDAFILQVAGRKRWEVYAPTRLHPLREDVEAPSRPQGPPVWEGILEDGDLLYLPRGWWHVAFPLDEPSLHLTVTVMPAVGEDLLAWFTSRLKRHPEFRMDLPHLADAAGRARQLARMRELLLQDWDDRVMERFLAQWEAQFPVTPEIRLPSAPIDSRKPIDMEAQVRLAANHRLVFVEEPDGRVSFHANEVRWECPAQFVPALQRLGDARGVQVGQLCATLSDPAAVPQLMAFLTALAMGGAIWSDSTLPRG